MSLPTRLIGYTRIDWQKLSGFFKDNDLASPTDILDVNPFPLSELGAWDKVWKTLKGWDGPYPGQTATFAIRIESAEVHSILIQENLSGIEINYPGIIMRIVGAPLHTWVDFILKYAKKNRPIEIRQLAVSMYLELRAVYKEPFLDYRLINEGWLEA